MGVTQAALAVGMGCTQGNVGHYEKGQTVPPSAAKRLIAYAATLGHAITFDHIYGETAGGDWGTAFDSPAITAGLVPEGQGSRPAVELTADPALNADLARAEQAGLVKLPHPAPAWDGVERRVAQVPRRAVDRERDIYKAGKVA